MAAPSNNGNPPARSSPRDALVMQAILKEMGITDFEPRVVNQMLEFTYRYVTTVLEDARVYSSYAAKKELDIDDVRLALQTRMDHSFTSPPPRDFLIEIARQKNSTPLPLLQPKSGLRLPPDRYCLTANNYKFKQTQKKSQPKPSPVIPGRAMPPFPAASKSVSQPGTPVQVRPPHLITMTTTPVQAPQALIRTAGTLTHAQPITTIKQEPMEVQQTTPTTTVTYNVIPVSTTTAISATSQAAPAPNRLTVPVRVVGTTAAAVSPASILTVSGLPSMAETVASSLQQQALVTSLKRKHDDEDDYDV